MTDQEHWVQIEMPPQGERTSYTHMDLSRINRTEFVFNNNEFFAAVFHYGMEGGPTEMLGDAGKSFYEKYTDYIDQKLKSKDERAEPSSNIIIQGGVIPDISRKNRRR
jgi:hypothetical protein